MNASELIVSPRLCVGVQNGGLFISRGMGIHPDRRIDSHELIFVRDGVLGIEEEGRDFHVRAGESLILWPDRRHCGNLPYGSDLSFYWVHFNVTSRDAVNTGEISVPQHVRVMRPDNLTVLFRRLLEDQESGDLTPLDAGLLVLQMLSEASRSRPSPGPGPLPLAARADVSIRTRFAGPLTASVIASELGCNPNYLNIVYRRAYGRTLTEAIHACRLRHARRMLTDGEGNIDEIARACGFPDSAYFRRLFKRVEGLSPRAFRRLYARVHTNTA